MNTMSFENEFFKKKKPIFQKLLEFGFSKNNDIYIYQENFLNDQFRAEIIIHQNGNVFGKVIDKDLEEEYTAFRSELRTGEFIGSVRENYGNILKNIADNCFCDKLFIFDQSNRMAEKINVSFQENADYPFSTAKTYGVFRNPKNKKWYALIMNISKEKLTKNPSDKDTEIEIMNLKILPEKLQEFLNQNGIYPAYHMNHSNWISIILDDTLNDDILFSLISQSRELTKKQT